MYFSPDISAALRQGEILSSLTNYIYDPSTDDLLGPEYEFVVIAGQDCDLDRFHSEPLGDRCPVLFFPASPAEAGRKEAQLNSTLWSFAKKNDHDRFHVLQACDVAIDLEKTGIPDLLVDFRRFFVMQYQQVICQFQNGTAKRRACLSSPYKEHFQDRALNYLGCVALDPPHTVGGTITAPVEGASAEMPVTENGEMAAGIDELAQSDQIATGDDGTAEGVV